MHSFTEFLRKTAAAVMLTALPSTPMFAQDWDHHDGHRIRHVFVIVLENEGYDVTFGPASKAPYLSQTLVSQGVLLSQYYGTGHVSLDNYMAMISGQAGTLATHADCLTYADFVQTGITPDGQAIGTGCVYPASIKTLPDQLKAVGKTWRGYMEDMGNDPARESATCGRPQLNTLDLTQTAEKPSAAVPQGDQYASRHDPFVYFHSIVDSSDCQQNVVNLNQLTQDLKSEETTPNFVFITPNLCDDGHDSPCVTGQPGGLVSADAFLKKWVPIITNSPAYKEDGLIVINFDEGGFTTSVSSTGVTITFPGQFCCNEQPGPNAAPDGRGASVSVPEAGHGLGDPLQPLFVPEDARRYLRDEGLSRLCGTAGVAGILRLCELGYTDEDRRPVCYLSQVVGVSVGRGFAGSAIAHLCRKDATKVGSRRLDQNFTFVFIEPQHCSCVIAERVQRANLTRGLPETTKCPPIPYSRTPGFHSWQQ